MKCRNCNKATERWGNRYRYYCDRKCQREYESNEKRKVFKIKKCKVCDSEYMPKSSIQIYCSYKCSYQVEKNKRSNKPEFKKCAYCENEFKPYTSLDKYCSANCRIDNQKSKRSKNWNKKSCENITGKKNPAYRNGNYSRGNRKSAEGERKYQKVRDGMRTKMIEKHGYLFCERCNTNTTYQWEMHHIVYRSEKPRHEHLHSERNLVNLCIKCHNWFHNKKSRRNDIVKERGLVELFGQEIVIL